MRGFIATFLVLASPVWAQVTNPSMPTLGVPNGTAQLDGAGTLGNNLLLGRTLAARAFDVLNVKDFGAKCDGVTDDTAALRATLISAAAHTGGVSIYLPAGQGCLITSSVQQSFPAGLSVTLFGDGPAASQILLGFDGIGIELDTASASASVSRLSFTKRVAGTHGEALRLISTTADAPTATIRDVAVNVAGANLLARGIYVKNFTGSTIDGLTLRSTANTVGVGLQIDGSTAFPSLNNKISNMNAEYWQTQVLIGDGTTSYVQGVGISNSTFVLGSTAIEWIQGSGYDADWLSVSGSHIGAAIDGVVLSNVSGIFVDGNYFLPGFGSMVRVSLARSGMITGNEFYQSGTTYMKGIEVASQGDINQGFLKISGNYFVNFASANADPLYFAVGTAGNVVTDNRFTGVSKRGVDLGTNTWRDNSVLNYGGEIWSDTISERRDQQEAFQWQARGVPSLKTNYGLTIGWNRSAAYGETDLLLGSLGAPGGLWLYMVDGSGNIAVNPVVKFDGAGNLSTTGSISPGGPVQYPSFIAANLPTSGIAGRQVFCSNCAKPSENAAAGTGTMVFDDGHSHWVSMASPTPLVSTIYTGSGTIAPTDNRSILNGASPLAMTLGNGTSDGQVIVIKNLGTTAATVTGAIDGIAANGVTLSPTGPIKGVLRLSWSTSASTWVAE